MPTKLLLAHPLDFQTFRRPWSRVYIKIITLAK
jgi:hypothetical protein